jgi:hypothetical protein
VTSRDATGTGRLLDAPDHGPSSGISHQSCKKICTDDKCCLGLKRSLGFLEIALMGGGRHGRQYPSPAVGGASLAKALEVGRGEIPHSLARVPFLVREHIGVAMRSPEPGLGQCEGVPDRALCVCARCRLDNHCPGGDNAAAWTEDPK